MGLLDGLMGNASEIEPERIEGEFARVLAPGGEDREGLSPDPGPLRVHELINRARSHRALCLLGSPASGQQPQHCRDAECGSYS
jgi:hypothetical protein